MPTPTKKPETFTPITTASGKFYENPDRPEMIVAATPDGRRRKYRWVRRDDPSDIMGTLSQIEYRELKSKVEAAAAAPSSPGHGAGTSAMALGTPVIPRIGSASDSALGPLAIDFSAGAVDEGTGVLDEGDEKTEEKATEAETKDVGTGTDPEPIKVLPVRGRYRRPAPRFMIPQAAPRPIASFIQAKANPIIKINNILRAQEERRRRWGWYRPEDESIFV